MMHRSTFVLALLTASLAACGEDGESPDPTLADAGAPDAVAPGPDPTPGPAIVSFSQPGIDHFHDDLTGFRFTVGAADVIVTELGFFDENADGLGEAHEVAIYDVATQREIVRASVPAGTAASLEGAFRFVPVAPATLAANASYVAVTYRTSDVDGVAYEVRGLATSSAIHIDADIAANGAGGLRFVNTSFAVPDSWFGPNFKLGAVAR